jgi:hypothetical protein
MLNVGERIVIECTAVRPPKEGEFYVVSKSGGCEGAEIWTARQGRMNNDDRDIVTVRVERAGESQESITPATLDMIIRRTHPHTFIGQAIKILAREVQALCEEVSRCVQVDPTVTKNPAPPPIPPAPSLGEWEYCLSVRAGWLDAKAVIEKIIAHLRAKEGK